MYIAGMEQHSTFDSVSSWSFNNEFARNVIVFGVDKSSSSHSDNRIKTF